jgi:hypothetical protein
MKNTIITGIIFSLGCAFCGAAIAQSIRTPLPHAQGGYTYEHVFDVPKGSQWLSHNGKLLVFIYDDNTGLTEIREYRSSYTVDLVKPGPTLVPCPGNLVPSIEPGGCVTPDHPLRKVK